MSVSVMANRSTMDERPPRRLQFTLRTALLALIALSVFFAWPGRWIFNRIMLRVTFSAIRNRGGSVEEVPGAYAVKIGNSELWRLKYLGDAFGLDLAGTQASDDDLAYFQNGKNLRILDLSGTKVTGAGLAHLRGCSELRLLFLADTKVADEGLEHLRTLTNLEILILDGTQVSDAGMVYLKHLPKLREIALWGTNVSAAGILELTSLPKLEHVGLSEPETADAALQEFQRQSPGVTVFFQRVVIPR